MGRTSGGEDWRETVNSLRLSCHLRCLSSVPAPRFPPASTSLCLSLTLPSLFLTIDGAVVLGNLGFDLVLCLLHLILVLLVLLSFVIPSPPYVFHPLTISFIFMSLSWCLSFPSFQSSFFFSFSFIDVAFYSSSLSPPPLSPSALPLPFPFLHSFILFSSHLCFILFNIVFLSSYPSPLPLIFFFPYSSSYLPRSSNHLFLSPTSF